MENQKQSLCSKIFVILDSSETHPLLARAENGTAYIFYEENKSSFFEIDFSKKIANFHGHAKDSYVERNCMQLISMLKEQNYEIKGESFFEKPIFEKGEFSLY